jgi:hypothetical protein
VAGHAGVLTFVGEKWRQHIETLRTHTHIHTHTYREREGEREREIISVH